MDGGWYLKIMKMKTLIKIIVSALTILILDVCVSSAEEKRRTLTIAGLNVNR